MSRLYVQWPFATVLTLFLGGNAVVLGAIMLTGNGSEPERQLGLAFWLTGAVITLDLTLLSRGGRPMGALVMFTAAAGLYLTLHQIVPTHVTDGVGQVLLIVATVVLAVMAFTPWDLLVPSRVRLSQALAAEAKERAIPERPADPAAEIARIQGIISAHIESFQEDQPREAREMLELLEVYRRNHGTDTVTTSSRPGALRNATEVLVEDFERIRDRLPARAGRSHAIVVLSYARLMSDIACNRTR